MEGELRFNHSRIIAHAEEIAFYRGAEREKEIAMATFSRIKRHLRKVFFLHFGHGIIDSIMVKYLATQLSWFVVSIPVFGRARIAKRRGEERDSSMVMEEFSSNFSYLINLAQAIGRLVLAGRDLTRFAGYTYRVSEFFDVLNDINNGRYQRTMVSGDVNGLNEVKIVDQNSLSGKVIEKDGVIEFINVPICTPNGDVLVPEMCFKVESGMNCLITGPNGCGKSSLFRILGGIWPTFGGTLIKPSARNMFYVPQKPYLTLGSLRDQLIYPDDKDGAKRKGFGDTELIILLGKVNLEYLVNREGGWETVRDWADVLSGGEKQRVAMARLFYHRPQFAILDECTSAVSIDVEGKLYRYAKELDITLFTVSHRPTLVQFHDHLLRFDGLGNYEFIELKHDESSAGNGNDNNGGFSFIMNRPNTGASGEDEVVVGPTSFIDRPSSVLNGLSLHPRTGSEMEDEFIPRNYSDDELEVNKLPHKNGEPEPRLLSAQRHFGGNFTGDPRVFYDSLELEEDEDNDF